MFKTGLYLVGIFGTIFGGAYALDRLAKLKEKRIEEIEQDEVELDIIDEEVCEDFCWVDDLFKDFQEEMKQCAENRPCKCGCCDADGDRDCCGNCKCDTNEGCCGNCKCNENNEE